MVQGMADSGFHSTKEVSKVLAAKMAPYVFQGFHSTKEVSKA